MKHRWANTLMLVFIIFQVATGTFGLAAGDGDRSFYLWAHNAGAFAIALVLIWKTAIGARSLQRPSSGRPRIPTLLLTALLLATLVLGFTWPTLGYWSISGTSGISLHIWIAFALTPLVGYHSWRYTRRFKTGFDADRRAALRLLGLGGAGVAAWLAIEGVYSGTGLAAGNRRFTGSHERRSYDGNLFPTTSWLNDDPAQLDRERWRLAVIGVDGQSQVLSYEDLTNHGKEPESAQLTATLDCTSGWYSEQAWAGVRLIDLWGLALADGARTIEVRSVTGYRRKFSLESAQGFMLATHVGGEPLSHGHGAPLRLVAPGRRGFEWVKWVTEVRLLTSSHWLQPPFPLD